MKLINILRISISSANCLCVYDFSFENVHLTGETKLLKTVLRGGNYLEKMTRGKRTLN
jgi:hypothetical protein